MFAWKNSFKNPSRFLADPKINMLGEAAVEKSTNDPYLRTQTFGTSLLWSRSMTSQMCLLNDMVFHTLYFRSRDR